MKMNKKGFTLIELLIVVAIIAILAAIAIPQFSSYRIRGYNSAATADMRNARTAEEAFFSDWQVYASSTAASGAPAVPGPVMTNALPTVTVPAGSIVATPPAPSAATTMPLGISQGVGISIGTSGSGGSFTIVTKNTAGDRCFGMDSDVTQSYWVNGVIGTALLAAANPATVAATNDLNGATGVTPCTGVQTTWVSL